jgi:hypothetical protein
MSAAICDDHHCDFMNTGSILPPMLKTQIVEKAVNCGGDERLRAITLFMNDANWHKCVYAHRGLLL